MNKSPAARTKSHGGDKSEVNSPSNSSPLEGEVRWGGEVTIFCLICLFTLFLTTPVTAGVWRESISGDLEFRAYYDRITGNEDLSYKTDGANYLTDLYFYFQPSREETNGIHYRGMFYLQGTDDPQYQTRGDNWRVQNVYLTATSPGEWELTGGHFSSRYTQYTMNSTLLGLDGWLHATDNFRLKTFAGRQRRARSNEQYARYAGGVRGELEPFANHELGLNYIHTQDHTGSLSGADLDGVGDTIDNTVYSLDYEGSFFDRKLRLDGEIATSEGELDSDTDYDNELARRIRGRVRPFTGTQFTARYEKVDPDFETEQGFANTDRRRREFRFDQRLTDRWDLNAEYSNWENIDSDVDQRDVTNWLVFTSYQSEIDYFGTQQWDLSFERDKDSGDNEADEKVWEFGLDNLFTPAHRVNIRYFREEEEDEEDNETDISILRLGYSGDFQPYELPLNYDLSTEYREDDIEDGTDRRWRLENDFTVQRTDDETFSFYHHYQTDKDAEYDDIVRHSYGADYTYVLCPEFGNRITLGYEETDTTDKEDSDRDYREQTFELNVEASF